MFVEVASAGSFSRAATIAGSTQSSVSKRMLALERALDCRLFERTGRGARLTDSGRLLLPRAEALVTDADRLRDVLSVAIGQPRGQVRLAVQQSVAWPLVGRVCRRITRSYPNIRLEVSESPMKQIDDGLREGRIDVGLLSRLPHEAPASEIPLFAPTMLLVAPKGDALTRSPTIDFGRLATLPLIVASMSNAARVLLEEQARRRGIKLKVALEVNSTYLTKRLVASGAGYAITSREAIVDEVRNGTLSASRIVRPQFRQRFYLSVAGNPESMLAVRVVADVVRAVTRMRPES